MPKLSHQWGYVSRDVFDRHPHAETMGMVDGPFPTHSQAWDAAIDLTGNRGVGYFIVRRIPGGPWLSKDGRSPVAEWQHRWGEIPKPEGAKVIPLRRID